MHADKEIKGDDRYFNVCKSREGAGTTLPFIHKSKGWKYEVLERRAVYELP